MIDRLLTALVTWLRADRLSTQSYEEADRSRWVYGPPLGYRGESPPPYWTTSILGIINGVLRVLGLVLVAHADPETHQPTRPYLTVRRVWWDSWP